MTDLTDQELRDARQWAERVDAHLTPSERALLDEASAARVILATVDAPAPTPAEALRDMLEKRDACEAVSFSGLLARVEQVQQERDEARAEVERLDAVAEDYARRATAALTERDDARAEVESLAEERDRAQYTIAEVTNARDSLREAYDHARAEVERLNREQGRLQAQVRGLVRLDGDRNSEMRMITGERNEALIEVERLTDERDEETVAPGENVSADQKLNMQEILAGSLPNPADVKPGEPWEVIATDPAKKIGGGVTKHNTVAFRMADRWIVSRQGYPMPLVVPDDCIRLVRRHVPAPRVITNPDELDVLAFDTTVRVGDTAYQRGDEMLAFGGDWWYRPCDSVGVTSAELLSHGPVTVLWEPVA